MHRTCETETAVLDWMRTAVHDLCQPITALECVLFLATMSPHGTSALSSEELMATIRSALEQCERISARVRAMQEWMQASQSWHPHLKR